MLIAVHLPVHHRTFITGCRTSRRVGPIEVADPFEALGPTLTAQLEQFVIEVAALLASLVGDGLGGGLARCRTRFGLQAAQTGRAVAVTS